MRIAFLYAGSKQLVYLLTLIDNNEPEKPERNTASNRNRPSPDTKFQEADGFAFYFPARRTTGGEPLGYD
jgi:hypothetical protein